MLFFLALIMVSLFNAKDMQASSTGLVNATVKISVCGNGIIENGEDCESGNLQGKICSDLGYSGGSLACDISCSFDTSNCNIPSISSTSGSSTTSTTTTASSVLSTATPTPTPECILPTALQVFDISGFCKIRITDLPIIVKLWIDEWKEALIEEIARAKGETMAKTENRKCDINGDGECNIKDFSILLFYVER